MRLNSSQLNNKIGRAIATSYPNATNKYLAERVLNEFNTNGLYVAIQDKDGSYYVERKIIPDNVYQLSKQKLNQLDHTGAGKEIQNNRKKLKNRK